MSDLRKVFNEDVIKQKSDLVIAIAVISCVIMLLLPLPTIILDLMQAINLIISLSIILITLYIGHALEFSIFPTLLLITTIFSLSLNVSSTRLILSLGENFDGKLIKSFSTFVTGTSEAEGLLIGFVIFLILILIQFLVITKGSTRVSEVAARFTLDALPGKQMAIDQEYSSGLITEEETQKRKRELQKEVDFYGAMDGASKFISGNVVAGIFITIVNIIAGIITGMIYRNESIGNALSTYTRLTIGDGLVSQLPSLLISTATGITVTRSVSDGTFGKDATEQFSAQHRIYWIVGFVLVFLSVLPGFPWYILLPLAAALFYLGYKLSKKSLDKKNESVEISKEEPKDKNTDISPVAPLDPISLELGYALISLVDKESGTELLDRITKIRREIALELGLVIPRIRIIDNMKLEASQYSVKIKGIEIGSGVLRIGSYLCINPSGIESDLEGEKTLDPTFSLPALWINEKDRERAERAGMTVVDSPSIIATHLTEIIKRNAKELLGRKETFAILEELKKEYAALISEVQENLNIGDIQKVLQGLLEEQISIRNIISILEILADYAKITKDSNFLIEKARQVLARQICLQYKDENNNISVITIQPDLEQLIIDSKVESAGKIIAAMHPELQNQWLSSVLDTIKKVQEKGYYPIILTQEVSRALVKTSLKRELPNLVVLSVPEIVNDVGVSSIAQISINNIENFLSQDQELEEEF